MTGFREKSIFVWNDAVIGDAAAIVQMLQAANFEAAYLHSTMPSNWRSATRPTLAAALKAAGFAVYASVACYGYDPANDGHMAAAIVNQYGLDGCVFDIEAGLYETASDAPARVRKLFEAYQQMTAKPSAFCGWAFYHAASKPGQIYHPVAVLVEAMKLADAGMPMAYWYGGDDPATAERYAALSMSHWRAYTDKPIVLAGRAYNDAVACTPQAVAAFDARARAVGAAGITWWDMEHARRIPGVWEALAQTPRMGGDDQPIPEEPMENLHKSKAMLLITKDDQWTNPAFAGYIAYAGKNLDQPNQLLKPIELKARAEGKPFGILYDFSMAQYTRDQVPRDPALWPPYHLDYPLQAFWDAVKNRDVDFVVIRMLDPNDHTGQPGDQGWVSYAAETFINNAYNLIKANKPEVKLVVASNNSFIATYAPAINNWIGKADRVWDLWIDQLVPAHDESFPRATDKPAYLGAAEDTAARKAWQLWRYWPTPGMGLVLYNGTAEQLRAWAGAAAQDPGTGDPGQGSGDDVDLAELLALARELKSGQQVINSRLDNLDAGQQQLLQRMSNIRITFGE